MRLSPVTGSAGEKLVALVNKHEMVQQWDGYERNDSYTVISPCPVLRVKCVSV